MKQFSYKEMNLEMPSAKRLSLYVDSLWCENYIVYDLSNPGLTNNHLRFRNTLAMYVLNNYTD